jgi:hypothetical protein
MGKRLETDRAPKAIFLARSPGGREDNIGKRRVGVKLEA